MKPSIDPFIQKLRQMCTKDKIVQALYHDKISWSDVPSDDDVLEMDDWKSYEKMEARAKEAYKHHIAAQNKYTVPRSKTKKNSQFASQPTRKQRALPVVPIVPLAPALPVVPALLLPVVPVSIVKKEIVENHNVYQPPIEYEEIAVVPSTELVMERAELIEPTEFAEPTEFVEPTDVNSHKSDKRSSLHYYVFLLIILIYVMMHK